MRLGFKMDRPIRSLLPRLEPGGQSQTSSAGASPASSGTPYKRRCVSTACLPCRKRKSKCDGAKPGCFACRTTYSSPCYYDVDSDHRRKGALKRDIAQLKGELNAQTSILEALRKGADGDVDDIINLIRANPDDTYESIADNIQKLNLETRQKQPSGTYGLEGELEVLTAEPGTDKMGDFRQYGHTSNLYYARKNEDQPLKEGDHMGRWTDVTNDDDFVKHLLDLYFTWSHPFYLLFSEEMFYHGLRDGKLNYCTPLLVNAILALGCLFSKRPEALADPNDAASRGAHFFKKAKELLEADDRSALTTIQALGIMSIRQAKSNYDSSGWQYGGQMMSMSVQLGLHMQSAAEPNMTVSEVEARRITFWGIFSLHTAWSVCVGRISSLPRAAIRLEKPELVEEWDVRPWIPYGLPKWDGLSKELVSPSHKYSMLVQMSLLSEILNDILGMFYAPRDRITSRKLQYYHEKLQTWYRKLPSTLHINEIGPTTPQVYSLHMFYHTCIIQLFRPFLKVSFIQSDKTPRQICSEKANSISRLMDQYVVTYGLDPTIFIQSHCVMSAGIIHLVDISSAPTASTTGARREQSESFLASSIRQLHAISATYPLVKRYHQAMVGLTQKWCTIVPEKVKSAIADTVIESPSTNTTPPAEFQQTFYPNNTSTNTSTTPPSNSDIPPSNSDIPTPPYFTELKHGSPDLIGMSSRYTQSQSQTTPSYHQNLHQFAPAHLNQNHQHFHQHSNDPSRINVAVPPSYQDHLYWTPFPDSCDGVPLPMPLAAGRNFSAGNGMSVTSMLDGEFPHLSQDGFMLSSCDIGINGSAPPFWAEWEGSR